MRSDVVLRNARVTVDLERHGSFFVENIAGRHVEIAVFFDRLPVLGGLHAVSAVRRVAFDDRAVELFDEFADEFGTKMVRLHRFAGGNLDAELALGLPFERFVKIFTRESGLISERK